MLLLRLNAQGSSNNIHFGSISNSYSTDPLPQAPGRYHGLGRNPASMIGRFPRHLILLITQSDYAARYAPNKSAMLHHTPRRGMRDALLRSAGIARPRL